MIDYVKYEYTADTFKRKLPPEFKASWLAALRGGSYAQGQGALRADDNYCCMGVACDVYDPYTWKLSGSLSNSLENMYSTKSKARSFPGMDDLPSDVSGVLDQKVPDDMEGSEHTYRVKNLLERFNDIQKWSFNRIADWIERCL